MATGLTLEEAALVLQESFPDVSARRQRSSKLRWTPAGSGVLA